MKLGKVFICVALASSFVLAGCQSGEKKTDYFKKYNFVAQATSKQIEAIRKGVSDNIVLLTSCAKKTESYEKSSLREANQSSETKINIFDDRTKKDLLMVETNASSNSSLKNNGITLKTSSKSKTKEWDTGDGYTITYTEITSNKNTEKSASAYELTESSEKYKSSRIASLVNIPSVTTGSLYVNEDGSYTLIYSNISRSISAVEWGSSTKEYIVASKNQQVYQINKEYRLTSYYAYQESSTNRDPSTGEWYSSEKLVSYSYSSTKYEYGTRSYADAKEWTKTAAADNIIALYASVKVYDTTAGLVNGAYFVDSVTPTERSIRVSSQSVSDGKTRFGFNSNLSYTNNSNAYRAQTFAITITSISRTGEKVETTYPIVFARSIVTSTTNPAYVLVTSEDPKYTYIINASTYYTLSISLVVSFDGSQVTVEACVIDA